MRRLLLVAPLVVGACAEDPVEDNILVSPDADDDIAFTISVPPGCETQSCGLILDLPGAGLDADMHDRETQLRALGEQHGYIVVQPTAPTIVADGPWWFPQDDPALAEAVRATAERYSVDTDRVHVVGHNVSGSVAWRLLCEYPGVFASAAILGTGDEGCAPMVDAPSCTPDAPVDVLLAHGINDPVVDLACAQQKVDRLTDAWDLQEQATEDHDNFHRTHLEAPTGNAVDFIVHAYETDFVEPTIGELDGHCVPGGDGVFSCGDPQELAWGREAIEFFVAHPR